MLLVSEPRTKKSFASVSCTGHERERETHPPPLHPFFGAAAAAAARLSLAPSSFKLPLQIPTDGSGSGGACLCLLLLPGGCQDRKQPSLPSRPFMPRKTLASEREIIQKRSLMCSRRDEDRRGAPSHAVLIAGSFRSLHKLIISSPKHDSAATDSTSVHRDCM